MKLHFFKSIKPIFHRLILWVIPLVICHVSFGEVVQNTINQVDKENRKQGSWIEYCNGVKIREGNYINNKKNGIWKNYRKDGILSYVIQFVNGIPNGEMCSYYANGNLLEKGNWVSDHWEGEYYCYSEKGNISGHFFFNKYGKRTGYQEYYHENGKVSIKGNWFNGNKEGEIQEFYENGELRSKKHFSQGQLEEGSCVEYPRTPEKAQKQGTTTDVFSGNGHYILYNKFRKPDREGDFADGKFLNGKRYFYDANGILVKTAIYQNSKIIRWITHSEQ
ncbi:toxin-antitoxin system YwqK family antitoxin [Ancylomarina longa]|uniref:Toxin-antitoxin system YwqK family antitoxin n=1 Tax=Ancylomarina longa TaxID=2487017 RepID=A0A434ATJ5_9BACT|nr:hypothetical protein [Ancylomarina longa]RUT77732.1 hypothetical protein DLK05_11740 [Ancylomarina longa]